MSKLGADEQQQRWKPSSAAFRARRTRNQGDAIIGIERTRTSLQRSPKESWPWRLASLLPYLDQSRTITHAIGRQSAQDVRATWKPSPRESIRDTYIDREERRIELLPIEPMAISPGAERLGQVSKDVPLLGVDTRQVGVVVVCGFLPPSSKNLSMKTCIASPSASCMTQPIHACFRWLLYHPPYCSLKSVNALPRLFDLLLSSRRNGTPNRILKDLSLAPDIASLVPGDLQGL